MEHQAVRVRRASRRKRPHAAKVVETPWMAADSAHSGSRLLSSAADSATDPADLEVPEELSQAEGWPRSRPQHDPGEPLTISSPDAADEGILQALHRSGRKRASVEVAEGWPAVEQALGTDEDAGGEEADGREVGRAVAAKHAVTEEEAAPDEEAELSAEKAELSVEEAPETERFVELSAELTGEDDPALEADEPETEPLAAPAINTAYMRRRATGRKVRIIE